MNEPSELRIDDPARVRALAHPVRLALLDLLGRVPEATATECAEEVGESVASCSFHLRMLEKYGYIERAASRGREKPWRLVVRSWEAPPNPEVDGSVAASASLAELIVQREAARVRAWLSQAQRGELAPEWVQATTVSSATFWATSAELEELRRELLSIVSRFDGREDHPEQRPEGARRSYLFTTLNPERVTVDEAPGTASDAASGE